MVFYVFPIGNRSYPCCRMYNACAVREALEAFVPVNGGRTAVDLGASEDLRFSVSRVSRDIKRYSRYHSHYGKL